NLSGRHVSIPSADIGLAQLAMHSCYETAGTYDIGYLIRLITRFYEC
ncbi:MAG: M18 family aminopeptidase, partial [Lachnospiraceae bacterium]|nr:M18 family aminopeptidase [Lachnospiraceae bacterium]